MRDWIPAFNPLTEDIPAGGLARFSSIETTKGAAVLAKPNADSAGYLCVVSDVAAIPAGGFGQVTFDPRVILAYNPADGIPSSGDSLGAKSGAWLASKGKKGFTCLGIGGGGWTNAIRSDALSYGTVAAFNAASVNHGFTASATWEDTGVTIAIPSAGSYLLFLKSIVIGQISGAITPGTSCEIWSRFYDVTNSVVVGVEDHALSIETTGRPVSQSYTVIYPYVATGAASIRIEAYRTGGNTWGSAVFGNGTNTTTYGYLKY